MNITAYFSQIGVPKTGLSPTINIRDISDGSLTVSAAAMTEVGDGFYWYSFSGYNPIKDYSIRCDGGATLFDSDRYAVASTGLPADGSGFTALGDTRVANLDAAISTRTKPADTQAQVTLVDTCTGNTDMRGTDGANTTVPDAAGTAPTASEIQTEMEENGASLLDTIKDIVSHGTYGNSALQVLVAALQADLDNGTDGLGALKALIDILDGVADAIKAKTDNLPTDPADDSDIDTQLAAIKAETALIVADTNELQTDDIPGTLATLATAAVLKEVNQSLNGAKCVVDRAANTFKVYDIDGVTPMFTITKTTVENVDILTRT